jgi:hypothetical protein
MPARLFKNRQGLEGASAPRELRRPERAGERQTRA